jgi:hypothetical protein
VKQGGDLFVLSEERANCVAAGVGAIAGAAIGMVANYVGAKIAHREVTGRELLGAAIKGAATGAAAGFAAGASLLVTSTAVAGANVLGGVADRSVNGQTSAKVFSPKEIAKDAVSGAMGGAVASQAEGATQGLANAMNKMAATPGALTAEDAAGATAAAASISLNKAAIAKTAENGADLSLGVAQSASTPNSARSQQGQQPKLKQPSADVQAGAP